ncbi:MAG: PepSY-associated TM helix domain-containing protein [Solirubrobacteraceae bacterium]|nr:PepSY-associated TM helix domain-containing protein [Patulibacter sp.]
MQSDMDPDGAPESTIDPEVIDDTVSVAADTGDATSIVREVLGDEHLEVDGDRAAPTITPVPKRTPAARPAAKKRKKRLGNRPVFRVVQVTHRWLALITGVLLLLLVVTGCVLLYKAPIQHTLEHSVYYPSDKAHLVVKTPDQALEIVAKAEPKRTIANAVHVPTGNFAVQDSDYKTTWAVDASTGRIVKEWNSQSGFWALLDNIHECALSCEGYPLYVAALGKPIGGIFGKELTWSSLILGVMGLVLLVLVVGGLVLWWPGIKNMARGFKIRRGNRYKFHYDLHKVVGFVALPFLLMWALTGANFELPFVTNAWYAVLPGKKPAEVTFTSAKVPKGTKPITPAQAMAAVQRDYPGMKIVSLGKPDASDATSTYNAYLAHGFDPWKASDYPGDYGVGIDQFSGRTKVTFTDDYPHLSQTLEEQYGGATHMGFVLGPWWRSILLLFGLVPILLAVTGTTTWWIRRGKAKRKKQLKRERAKAAAAAGAAA